MTLTRREAEVAELVAMGLTNREIAARLFLSPRTIDGHVENVLSKLDMRSRSEVAAWVSRRESGRAAIGNLPVSSSTFVGRSKELAELRRLLGSRRMVTITGPGGCGKTRLAIQFAQGVSGRFPGGAWLVELAGVTEPGGVVEAVARAAGLDYQAAASLEGVLVDWLRERQLLLVLDNCEHLVAVTSRLVARLLAGCPGVRILATTREALRVSGEVVWQLAGLGAGESIELFLERASLQRPGWAPTTGELATIAEVCERLDGLPLALELAAVRLAALSPAEIKAHLDRRLQLLGQPSGNNPVRQQTLRATVDWSYELLGDEERWVFRHAAIFVGAFSIDALREALDEHGRDPVEVVDFVSRLLEKSLLTRVEPLPGESRFRMLETLREYGLEKLTETGEIAAARRAAAAHFLGLVERLEPEVRVATISAVRRLDLDYADLRESLRWSIVQEPAMAVRLASALAPYWHQRGLLEEGRRLLMSALATGAGAAELRSLVMARGATLASVAGDREERRRLSGEALHLGEPVDAWPAIALARANLALTASSEGEYDTAAEMIRMATDAALRSGERYWLYFPRQSALDLELRRGGLPDAEAAGDELLALCQEMRYDFGECVARALLAMRAAADGNAPIANVNATRAIDLAQRLGYRHWGGRALLAVAWLAARTLDAGVCWRLHGASAVLRDKQPLDSFWHVVDERLTRPVAADERREALLGEGSRLSAEEAYVLALQHLQSGGQT